MVDGSGYIFAPTSPAAADAQVGRLAGGGGRRLLQHAVELLVDMKAAPDAPTHLAVIFRHSEETFATALRPVQGPPPPPPEDLIPQFALVRECDPGFGSPALELPGYEAERPDRRLRLSRARRRREV